MKIIKTVIIGLGNIAQKYEDMPEVLGRIKYPTHVSAIQKNKGFRLFAGCDIIKENQDSFLKKVSTDVRVYKEYTTMIKKEKPDMVVVATPTNTHYTICHDAIAMGVRNILCEKPISYSFEEARRLLAFVKKKKAKIAFNYFRNYDSNYRKLCSFIREGKYGKICFIRAQYSKGIFNTSTHLLAFLIKVFGKAKNVQGVSQIPSGDLRDPSVTYYARFHDSYAFFKGCGQTQHAVFILELLFEKIKLVIDRDTLEAFYSHNEKKKQVLVKLDINRSMLELYENFYDHITKNKPLYCTHDEALRAIEIAEKAIKQLHISKRVRDLQPIIT